MTGQLNHHHRDTVRKIFSHPASANLEWHEIISLLQAVGTVEEEHNGKFKVTVGPTVEFIKPPRGKDIDTQMVVDLRRMLAGAGLAPEAS